MRLPITMTDTGRRMLHAEIRRVDRLKSGRVSCALICSFLSLRRARGVLLYHRIYQFLGLDRLNSLLLDDMMTTLMGDGRRHFSCKGTRACYLAPIAFTRYRQKRRWRRMPRSPPIDGLLLGDRRRLAAGAAARAPVSRATPSASAADRFLLFTPFRRFAPVPSFVAAGINEVIDTLLGSLY